MLIENSDPLPNEPGPVICPYDYNQIDEDVYELECGSIIRFVNAQGNIYQIYFSNTNFLHQISKWEVTDLLEKYCVVYLTYPYDDYDAHLISTYIILNGCDILYNDTIYRCTKLFELSSTILSFSINSCKT